MLDNLRKFCLLCNEHLHYSQQSKNNHKNGSSLEYAPVHNEIRYMADHVLRHKVQLIQGKPGYEKEQLKAKRHSDQAINTALHMILDALNREAVSCEDKYSKNAHLIVDTFGIKKALEYKKAFLDIGTVYSEGLNASPRDNQNFLLESVSEMKGTLENYFRAIKNNPLRNAKIRYYVKIVGTTAFIIYSIYSFVAQTVILFHSIVSHINISISDYL